MPTPKEHWGYTIEEWSKQPFSELLQKLPNNINSIFDIGANVGGFTEILHRNYPKAKIDCFEPIQNNFDELLLNTPYANHHKVGIYYGIKKSKAVWRGANDGAYFIQEVNSGEPRIFTGEEIDLVELESFDLPDLIKLDVEGAEENILEYSEYCKKCPNLIIEWHPDHINCFDFFTKNLPNHTIVHNIENKQFLLCLK